MSRSAETGVCILTIDLTDHGQVGKSRENMASDRFDNLRQSLAEAEIPVTWGINADQVENVRPRPDGRESDDVALVAHADWAGANRRAFTDGLKESLARLDAAGLHPAALVLRQGAIGAHDDLLVKYGIQMVCVSESRTQGQTVRGWWPRLRSSVPPTPVRTLRWGLWEVAAGIDLDRDGVRGAERMIDRSSRKGGLAIVVASAGLLVSQDRQASRLFEHLSRRRSEGAVRLETLTGFAACLQTNRSATAARSILRSAAA
ncbi:MAG TPA: hypothetical protein VHC22_22125 [Pirellulales bacterium]|nr:hypothetical protein [Pirellulales bacterium]